MNKMKIKFDKKLYKKKAITEAIRAFGHLGDFNVMTQKSCYELEISKMPVDIRDMVKNEFCNHVLFLMNK